MNFDHFMGTAQDCFTQFIELIQLIQKNKFGTIYAYNENHIIELLLTIRLKAGFPENPHNRLLRFLQFDLTHLGKGYCHDRS